MRITDLIERQSPAKINDQRSDTLDDDSLDNSDGLLGEPDDLLDPDPRPARRSVKARPPQSTKITVGQRRGIEDALRLMIMMPGGVLAMRDPHCGDPLVANAEAIAKAAAPIICRNPRMLAWFLGDNAQWMEWYALFVAVSPVATAVWQHHLAPGRHREDQGGEVSDAQPDYSIFSAPSFA